MFVQDTKSKREGKTYHTHLVRESFRTPDGPRSRTVCNISELPEETRLLIAASLKGQKFFSDEAMELAEARDFGGIALLRDAWDRFELNQLFPGCSSRARGLIQAMTFSRILFPGSKRALGQLAEGTVLAQACGLDAAESFDENDLYRAMDELSGHWAATEKQLYRQAMKQPPTLVLYDLTSIYFEGNGPQEMGQFGYSRDHRGDRHQILLAVATDSEGIPIHMEVLRGNRADTTTLQGLLATLRRRFGLKEAVFCFDGGMSSKLNLEHLEAEQIQYVTRLSSATLGSLLKELPTDKQMALGDRAGLIEFTHEERRYVIAGGAWRAEHDAARRNARIQKAELELTRLAAIERQAGVKNGQKLASQIGRKLQSLSAHKYFSYEVDPSGKLLWSRREDVIQNEQKTDGWYLLHTGLSIEQATSAQVLHHYKNLLEVEDAFRQLKSYLEVRPIYHYRPDRVRNHIRICFLAYWITARLGQQWQACGYTGRPVDLLRRLQQIRLGHIAIKGKPLRCLMTSIPAKLNEILAQIQALSLFSKPPAWKPPVAS
jgi:hypothetical protein